MGEDPREIRTEIEETRGRLGETAEAIGYKSDVKSRAGEWASEKKDAMTSRATETKDRVSDKVTGAVPDTDQMRDRARRGLRIARENPLGLAVAGAAVGFLAGVAVPSTRIEDERLGPAADQVKEAAREAGHEVVERGKSAAQTAGSVMETGRGSGTGDSGY